MNLLIVNDDGIRARGIHELAKELSKEHRVTVVAPEEQHSAKSHAITVFRPLTVRKTDLEGVSGDCYTIDGTPADCTRTALTAFLAEERFDLVISGINLGENVGQDIWYSGTVAAAREAGFFQIPSIAVSAEVDRSHDGNFSYAARYVRDLIVRCFESLRGTNVLLNVNIPNRHETDILGVKWCKVGGALMDKYHVERDGEQLSVKVAPPRIRVPEVDTDREFLRRGYVTVSPLGDCLVNHSVFEDWKERF